MRGDGSRTARFIQSLRSMPRQTVVALRDVEHRSSRERVEYLYGGPACLFGSIMQVLGIVKEFPDHHLKAIPMVLPTSPSKPYLPHLAFS